MDAGGRLILLAGTATIAMPSGTAAGAHALVIAFAEQLTDPAAAKYIPGSTRFTQAPSLSVKPFATAAPGEIVLATLTVNAAGNVTLVDTSTRTYAGLRLTGRAGNGFDLRPLEDDSLVVERFLAGDTSFTPLVKIKTTPSTTLEVAGVVSSTSGGLMFPDGTVQTGAVPRGIIMMWNGNTSTIPVGWALCDGDNGTPDLRSRFVVGAGPGSSPAYNPGDTGGPDAHTHAVDVPQLNGSTATAGNHSHPLNVSAGSTTIYNYALISNGDTTVISSLDAASAQTAGAHSHAVSLDPAPLTSGSSSGENRPRWNALCFIMKV
jgi:hypothetical protein